MRSEWESRFESWSQPPSSAEQERCDNAIRVVAGAISNNAALSRRATKTFAQGSFRNRVNISTESDVDIGVVCNETFFETYPDGMRRSDFGNVAGSYDFNTYKNELEAALVDRFGSAAVSRGNKAFTVRSNSYRLEADVVPLFEYRQYFTDRSYRAGVALVTDNEKRRIENYPEILFSDWPRTPLHYENAVQKNSLTNQRFKSTVRIAKRLKAHMNSEGNQHINIPGYLIECLIYNCPNAAFTSNNWYDRITNCLVDLDQKLAIARVEDLFEVDEIKYLFYYKQAWSQIEARAFIQAAMARIQRAP